MSEQAPGFTVAEVMKALLAAEIEAFEWATGKRSTTNILQSPGIENYVLDAYGVSSPDRQLTLVRIAEGDAAEARAARERVLTLRALAGLTLEGMDPLHVESVMRARHG